jgi:hypothetical protein
MHRFDARKLGGLVAAAALVLAQAAVADPSLQLNAFSVASGASEAKIVAATDLLMAAPVVNPPKGRLMLFPRRTPSRCSPSRRRRARQ